jgi:hypothetical protein
MKRHNFGDVLKISIFSVDKGFLRTTGVQIKFLNLPHRPSLGRTYAAHVEVY